MKDLALAFLRLGTTAFGGPAAHIAMMEEELLDLVGAAALIPGPSSTEVALYTSPRAAGSSRAFAVRAQPAHGSMA